MFNPAYDEPGLTAGLLILLAGLVYFPSIFIICQVVFRKTRVGQGWCHQFRISNNGIHDICNKIVSSIFAISSCTIGVLINRQCSGDIMHDRFMVLDNYMLFGASYFLYDSLSMYVVHNTLNKENLSISIPEVKKFIKENSLIVFHHTVVPLIMLLMSLRNGLGDCLIGTCLLIEASTPFVSIRVILVHLNLKECSLYILNGLLMLAVFFICRVMLFPLLYWWFLSFKSQDIVTAFLSIPLHCHIGSLVLWLPQLVWFRKMVQGSIKLIKEKQKNKNMLKNE